MSVINTNYLSLVAQNNLQKSQSALGTAIERLSSGLRINSAKDDAAGQAIANRMSSQVNGLNQAARNANDGISVAQTTEGALNQINDNLQRIRVLTVQSANGTNSDDDLTSIQNEIGQRLEEINRISKETSFNGVKVLATDEGLKIQVGANDSEAITIGLKQINSETLGLTGFNVDGKAQTPNTAATEADLKLADNVLKGGTVANPTYTLQVDNTAASATDVLNKTSTTAVTATGLSAAMVGVASGTMNTAISKAADGKFGYSIAGVTSTDIDALVTGTADGPVKATYTQGGTAQEILVASDGNITDLEGNQLFLTATNELTLNNGTPLTEASIDDLTAAIAADAGAVGNSKLVTEGGITLESDGGTALTFKSSLSAEQLVTLSKDNSLTFAVTGTQTGDTVPAAIRIDSGKVETVGDVAVFVNASGTLTTEDTTDTDLFVRENGKITDAAANQYFVDQNGNLTTEETSAGTKSVDPLKMLDAALNTVDALRSDLGAIQNRFISAITNLQTNVTNLSSARSRIEDADYAVEVANMSKNQILQQAGTSVLAQANQIPQGVLSLLR